MLLRAFVFIFLFFTELYSKEIPLIVISAGKTPQSYSTVGSQVIVIDSTTIKNSSESFLTDLLNNEVIASFLVYSELAITLFTLDRTFTTLLFKALPFGWLISFPWIKQYFFFSVLINSKLFQWSAITPMTW